MIQLFWKDEDSINGQSIGPVIIQDTEQEGSALSLPWTTRSNAEQAAKLLRAEFREG